MKTIHKTFKFRIYPTKEQEVLLAKHFGSCRFIYNHFLNERKEKYLNEKISLNYYDNAKALTQLKKEDGFIWLKETNAQALQQSVRNLDVAYRNFFTKQAKFPRFKSKHSKQSFRVPQDVFVEENLLFIPKFKEGIKAKPHRKIEGKILFATISKKPTGKYYASITCETEHKPYEKTGKSVGIDVGLKELAVLSDGTIYKNIKSLKSRIRELKYEQRQLSKKKKGGKSRNRQRQRVALVYEKITNIRYDYLQKMTTEIVKNHDIIAVEDLAVVNLMKNHKLAHSLADASLGTLFSMLKYKADWNDRRFITIDRFFPSSKTCSGCGWIKQDLILSIREWECESCGEVHDRDLNAAKNILRQGLNILSGCGTQSDIKQKQVEALPLGKSMSPDEVHPWRVNV